MPTIRTILAAGLLALTTSIYAQDNDVPNIVLILADDLGYGDVSYYNENSVFKTPNFDRLAEDGIAFTDAHTSSSVCTPTRYGILTGRYNWRSRLKHGVLSGYSRSLIDKDRLTLADLLREKGFATAVIGKWHLGWNWKFRGADGAIPDTAIERLRWGAPLKTSAPEIDFSQPVENGPNAHGFDYSFAICGSLDMDPYVYVENGISTTIPTDSTVGYDSKGIWRKGLTGDDFTHVDVLQNFTDKAVDFISEHGKGKRPFFLYFPLSAPHTPIIPSSRFIGRSNTNYYGDFVLQVDDVVGQIIKALEDNEILDRTIIIFTSDNGGSKQADHQELARAGHHSNYIFRGGKADIYEGGHRVPFIVHWPDKVKKVVRSDEIISTVDIMATIAEITGYDLPEDAAEDSHSFLPVLLGEGDGEPVREATVFHSIEGRFAIRKKEWKLILWPGSGGWSYPRTEEELKGMPYYQLYNLNEDPAEKRNLVYLYPEKVKELKGLLEKYVREGRSTSGMTRKNDGPERWPQLEWMSRKRNNEH